MKKSTRQPRQQKRKGAKTPSGDSSPAVSDGEVGFSSSNALVQGNPPAQQASATLVETPSRVGILAFIRQVRAEMARVSWPTRNETVITTIMVFVLVALAALFFLLADQILSYTLAWILGAR